MGLFNRKEKKIYSLEEALKLLKMPKYENYTTVPMGDGYKIVPEQEVVTNIDEEKANVFQKRRGNFLREMSGQGTYSNLSTTVPSYNNYQSAKRYQNQSCINLGR